MNRACRATTGAAIGAAALALGLAGTASAQVVDWTVGWTGQATLYAWIPSITGAQQAPDGEPLVNLDNADVLSAIDMALMGAAEARRGKFGFLFDAVYADLSQKGTWVQGRLDTKVETKLGFYTAAAFYRVHEADRTFVDLYGGVRYFDTKTTFEANTVRNDRSRTADISWTDGIVGIRGGIPLSEKWSLSGFADVGGFDAGSDLSWEFYGGANYAFAEHWAATIGYRYMSIEYEASDRATLDIDVQGPLIGITYNF
jgi:opacity protein-like surface antigen